MNETFQRCLTCDYPIPASDEPVRCPECGRFTDRPAAQRAVAEAMASPWRTVLRLRCLRRGLWRRVWRVEDATSHMRGRSIIALIVCAVVLPVATMTTSALVACKVTVWSEPRFPPDFVHRGITPFVEYHWFDWQGWSVHQDRHGEEAHYAVLFPSLTRRTVLHRSLTFSRWVFYSQAQDAGRICSVVAGWWFIWLVWRVLMRLSCPRRDNVLARLDRRGVRTAGRFSLILMAGLGVFVSAVLLVEMLIRVTVPQHGTAGMGVQWHALRNWLPWTLVLPATLLWLFGTAAPPTQRRWLRWPVVLILGPAVAWLVLRLTRLAQFLAGIAHPQNVQARPTCTPEPATATT